jgi:hypothetical protein
VFERAKTVLVLDRTAAVGRYRSKFVTSDHCTIIIEGTVSSGTVSIAIRNYTFFNVLSSQMMTCCLDFKSIGALRSSVYGVSLLIV